jgi:hypothetical protein
MMTNITLHVIRKDVLLLALGGFAEQQESSDLRAIPEWVGRHILQIAAKPRAALGEVSELAERSGRSVKSLKVMISRARRGYVPEYRRSA